jgi:hypothetical protein
LGSKANSAGSTKALRFSPSRTYLLSGAVALGLAAFSAWSAMSWWPAAIPAVLFVLSAVLVLLLASRPNIEVADSHLQIGSQRLNWDTIRRVDQTGWVSPMVADLTLANGRKIRMIYPGDSESSNLLLTLLQRNSTQALINGVPWRKIFGDPVPSAPEKANAPARYRLLNDEDEAEVEQLYQKLRAAGRLDPEK